MLAQLFNEYFKRKNTAHRSGYGRSDRFSGATIWKEDACAQQ
jgi:hypothetical protein